eukprot:gb/GFBE01007260.1/.p1 GENE.gb/GFBE01007260.1/~~gb/GFBE01007260.1/.p1  ORF type:complete len:444 (+),score=107.74 gb/GFBE01007260.1/:1-1332(+)
MSAPPSPSGVADARAALQALLSTNKSPSKTGGQDLKDQASQALRHLFRNDFTSALKPTKTDASLLEIEAKLLRLVEKAPQGNGTESGFNPPARVPAAKPTAKKPKLSPEDILATMEPEKLPEPLPRNLRQKLYLDEEAGTTAGLRVRLKENRKALLNQDRKVTALTAKLKQCRKDVWEQRMRQNLAELKHMRIIKTRLSELPPEMQKELEENEASESQLAEELSEARANAQRWVSVAKRQDGMLQQEREAQRGGDAMSIIAKHPAGEVFLPPNLNDSDSEEEEVRRPRRGREDVSLGSDSEDDDYTSTVASATATLQRSQMLGRQVSADSDEESVGSSVVSPSGESGSINFPDKASDSGSIASSPAGAAPKAPAAATRRLAAHDDSTSEEEVEKVEKNTSGPAAAQARPVPPLPGLSAVGRPNVQDEAEEVSSDECMETSRSI